MENGWWMREEMNASREKGCITTERRAKACVNTVAMEMSRKSLKQGRGGIASLRRLGCVCPSIGWKLLREGRRERPADLAFLQRYKHTHCCQHPRVHNLPTMCTVCV